MNDKGYIDQVEVLGVKVNCIDKEGLLRQVADWVSEDSKRTITYVNAHCLNIAAKDNIYRRLLNQFDLVYSDGIGVVWAGKLLAQSRQHKLTGRTWIWDFCSICQEQDICLYLLGGKTGIVHEAKKRLEARLPNLHILGVCDGYFVEKSEQQVLAELRVKKPDVLLVGMGVPRQEKWIYLHFEQLPAKVYWGVGALFDYVAGVEQAVPKWMDRLAMEWVWRLAVDPRGKWNRYIIGTPLFIGRVLWQKIDRIIKPKNYTVL